MDITQPVVFRMGETLVAFHNILRELDESSKCMSSKTFRRLVAYELLASPALLNYNYLFTTYGGAVYMEQRMLSRATIDRDSDGAVAKKGYLVLRAPLLGLVGLLLEHRVPEWQTREHVSMLIQRIVDEFPQHHCCWYNVRKKKACACDVKHLETQTHNAYRFCNKHWSPALREEYEEDVGMLCPPSEANLDEWLKTIV